MSASNKWRIEVSCASTGIRLTGMPSFSAMSSCIWRPALSKTPAIDMKSVWKSVIATPECEA